MTSSELLSLDNKIINKKFVIREKDMMIWPLVRWNTLYYLFIEQQDLSKPHASHLRLSIHQIKFIYDLIRFSPNRFKELFDIFFFVSMRGRMNDRNFNIFSDYYTPLLGKPIVIDSLYQGSYYIPDNPKNFALADYAQLKSFLIAYIKKIFLKKKNRIIEEFITYLSSQYQFDTKFLETTRKRLYDFYYGYDYYSSYYLKLFKKQKPKIIFIHSAVYGDFRSILIKIAKKLGINTAEFQHGIIYDRHPAYNYGDAIFKSKLYKQHLPDYILTYGDYWNEKIKIPSTKITIGNPHFYDSIEKYQDVKELKNSILIVSQGHLTHKFVNIAKYLAKNFENYKILFKLHPGEVPFTQRYAELNNYPNIEIAKTGDIYQYIAKYENVVGCYSTTMFEILGFNKKLFILDNEMSRNNIPKEIGRRFKKNEELKDLIKTTKYQDIQYDLDYYFNSNWKQNYKNFLREEIGILK